VETQIRSRNQGTGDSVKIKTTRQNLLNLLSRIAPVADAKSTMPILANVLLRADPDRLNGCLSVAASNLQIAMRAEMSVKVEEPGAICVPARDTLDRIKAMPEGEITIEANGTKVTIKTKGSARKFTLHGIPADEFPLLPELKQVDSSHESTAVELSEIIALTLFSVSEDVSRPHLNSLLLEVGKQSLRAVSTDGHRLSMYMVGKAEEAPRPWLVPKAAAQRLKALIDEASKDTEKPEMVRLAQSGNDLFATSGGFTLSVKLIDQQFPPWQQVIPDSPHGDATINRSALLGAVKALMVTTSDQTGGITFAFTAGKLKLKAESADKGEGVDELDCEYGGKSADYGMNGRYVIDLLSSMLSESVTLGISGPLDPVRVEPAQKSAGRTHCAVIMPMRI
jgi:DNA polymerase III subunit beta